MGCDKDWTAWQPIEARTEAMLDTFTLGLFIVPSTSDPSAPTTCRTTQPPLRLEGGAL